MSPFDEKNKIKKGKAGNERNFMSQLWVQSIINNPGGKKNISVEHSGVN